MMEWEVKIRKWRRQQSAKNKTVWNKRILEERNEKIYLHGKQKMNWYLTTKGSVTPPQDFDWVK